MLWQLFIGFLKVGCFSFGGAYAAIPLIRDVVQSYGWLTDEMLTDMIAISESTPGPLMVNLATYVGSVQAGLPGSVIATFAVILPAFVIILLVMTLLQRFIQNPYVQAVLRGLKACVTGVILATGVYMILYTVLPLEAGTTFDFRDPLLTAVLALLFFGGQKVLHLKKKISPILLIVIAAVLGIVAFSF